MATAEAAIRPHDRQKGRRPFASWMKRLTNLKNSASHDDKKATLKAKRKNNPYPESGFIGNGTSIAPTAPSTFSGRASSYTQPSLTSGRVGSFNSYEDGSGGHPVVMRSNKSTAPTLATNSETIHSDTGFSRAGTTYTDGIYSGRANSTFSSARASQESLTTTLTTIQSTAPSQLMGNVAPQQAPQNFSHQFPVSPPASALPPHLQTLGQPNTFAAATAGSLLMDNASILTLASSSKRRRRNSLDTNASVRAIAPSSVWGNSRESLPLSVLSSTLDRDPIPSAGYVPSTAPGRPSISGLAAERASIYSIPGGVGAPALVSERNSYYSTKQANNLDTLSVRSGHLGVGHGRAESINGSISGGLDRLADRAAATSPLASPVPRDLEPRSRRTSGWTGNVEEEEESEDEREDEGKDNDATITKVDSGKGKGKEQEKK